MHHDGAGRYVLKLPDQPGACRHAGHRGDVAQRRCRPHRPVQPPGYQSHRGHRHRGLHDRHEPQQERQLRIDRSAAGHQAGRRGAGHGKREDGNPERANGSVWHDEH